MSQINRISLNIPAQDVTAILDAIDLATSLLLPHLKRLDSEQRRGIVKMGDKNRSHVEKAMEYTRNHPEVMPGYVDVVEFERDFNGEALLRTILRKLGPLTAAVRDSMMLCGSDAYETALIFHRAARIAKRGKTTPYAEEIYADLASRFPSKGRSKKTPPESDDEGENKV